MEYQAHALVGATFHQNSDVPGNPKQNPPDERMKRSSRGTPDSLPFINYLRPLSYRDLLARNMLGYYSGISNGIVDDHHYTDGSTASITRYVMRMEWVLSWDYIDLYIVFHGFQILTFIIKFPYMWELKCNHHRTQGNNWSGEEGRTD